MRRRFRQGQEEMVGFALIIIIVAVVLVVFLSLSLRNKEENVRSYEVDSFIQSALQYTTTCKDNFNYRSVMDLILDCDDNKTCLDGKNSCEVLGSELEEIIGKSWKVEEEAVNKRYELRIISNEKEILFLERGNATKSSRGSMQPLPRDVKIFFIVYS